MGAIEIIATASLLGVIASGYALWRAWLLPRRADETALILVDQSAGEVGTTDRETINENASRVREPRASRSSSALHRIEQKIMSRQRIMIISVIACAMLTVWLSGSWQTITRTIMLSLLLFAIGVLWHQHARRKVQTTLLKEIDFFLPIVMERIVMAVEAGLDVLPAIQRVVQLEKNSHSIASERAHEQLGDPVSTLFSVVASLVESGLSFEVALSEVAKTVDSAALKHAFVHLSVAHQEGGELIMPLRELSDATQTYFQETVEEDIAKMPVRATLPLLCTFAGLILFFITAPLMQVLGLMSQAVPR